MYGGGSGAGRDGGRAATAGSLYIGRGCAGTLWSVYAGGGSALVVGAGLCSGAAKPIAGNTLIPPTAAGGGCPAREGRTDV